MDLEGKVLELEAIIEQIEEELEEMRGMKTLNNKLIMEHMEYLHFYKLEHEIYSGLLKDDKKAQRKAAKNRKV